MIFFAAALCLFDRSPVQCSAATYAAMHASKKAFFICMGKLSILMHAIQLSTQLN
jgi:hypothetical protein